MITLEGIRQAHTRIRGMVRCTPLYRSASLSEQCGMEILLKHEYQQITGSFKERGACNTLLGLDAEARRRGVVAASAGNHALGLAFHGQRLGIPVCVVMPRFAPLVKVHRCRALGARVLLVGSSFDDARSTALTIARDEGRTLVHGFDHPAIMEGQGTLGLELLEQEPDLDAIVVPVGGGGLLAGVATAVKSQRPEVAIIGVEAERAPTLTSALAHGGPTRVRVGAGLADGLAVAELGGQCFATLHDKIDGAEVVSEAEIAGAIVTLMELEKAVVEGAGAVGLAWARRRPSHLAGRRVAIVLSGGNIDLNVVSRVIERGLASAGRLCKIVVELPDEPGMLARLLLRLADAEVNLLQVEHDRNFAPADVAQVRVSLLLETRDAEHIAALQPLLAETGLSHRFVSDP